MLALLENYSLGDLYTLSLALFILGVIVGFIWTKIIDFLT